ncbi:MAG TPA: ABC transporter permease [Actinobacteria bacterium]|nr:ABC transporter permease [Actinomycetota bacterium]
MTTIERSEVWIRRRPGWAVIARKEFADHLLSVRFTALLVLLGLVALASVYAAAGALRDAAPDTAGASGMFLRLFTVRGEPVPFSFLTFVGFLAPILGIAFGFDAVNGERAQRTLPRLVAQPIHRDDVINGKFVAGLATVALILGVVTLIVAGLGIVLLGITPTAAEVLRLFLWYLVVTMFVGVWLAFATLCSVWMSRAATAALVAIGVWLVLALFGAFFARIAADVISPIDPADPRSALENVRTELAVARLSPVTLYEEAAVALLTPELRSVGLVTLAQLDRAVVSDLPVAQSLLLVWPQIVGLVAVTVVIFAAAYVSFMRQEIRA